MYDHTVTVVRPAQTVDGAGNGVLNWASTTRWDLPAEVQPAPVTRSSGETPLQKTWLVITAPAVSADVVALDRIEWDGDLFELVTEVQRWPNPITGALDHCEFTMARGEVPAFPDLVTFRRPATTRDAEYNPVATTTVVDTTPGLLAAPGPAGEGLVAGQAGLEVDTEVQVPVGTVARAGDVAVVAGRGTWRVVHVLEDRFLIRLRVTRSEP